MTLGQTVQDRITGFRGVLAGIALVDTYADSMPAYTVPQGLVVPTNEGGAPDFQLNSRWFDLDRLDEVSA